jgi:hypothetical protein
MIPLTDYRKEETRRRSWVSIFYPELRLKLSRNRKKIAGLPAENSTFWDWVSKSRPCLFWKW